MSTQPPAADDGPLTALGNTFLAGVFAALPLALTLAIIMWSAEFLHHYLGPESFIGGMLGSIGLNFVTSEITAYTLGFGIIIAAIYLLGIAVQIGLKNHVRSFSAALVKRVPFVRTLYQTISRLTALFDKQEQADYKGMKSVMCFFGGNRDGTATLALLTSNTPIEFQGKCYYAVIIPTAPVPFGGAILYVPTSWVAETTFGIEGLFNIYMSMGVTSTDYFTSPTPSKAP